jgi:hypothetical protein
MKTCCPFLLFYELNFALEIQVALAGFETDFLTFLSLPYVLLQFGNLDISVYIKEILILHKKLCLIINCFQNQTRPVLEKYKDQLVKASPSFQIYNVFKTRNNQRKRFFLLEILQEFSLKSPRKTTKTK